MIVATRNNSNVKSCMMLHIFLFTSSPECLPIKPWQRLCMLKAKQAIITTCTTWTPSKPVLPGITQASRWQWGCWNHSRNMNYAWQPNIITSTIVSIQRLQLSRRTSFVSTLSQSGKLLKSPKKENLLNCKRHTQDWPGGLGSMVSPSKYALVLTLVSMEIHQI